MTDPLVLRGLALAAVLALWVALRLHVRRAVLRRNEARGGGAARLRPLTWRPWLAGSLLVLVAVALAKIASWRHDQIRDLHLPPEWHLERSRFWSDNLAAGGIDLGLRVEGDGPGVERQVAEWLASRGPWDVSAEASDRDLRTGAMPLEPTLRQSISDEASWRRELLLAETRAFRVHFRRRGELHRAVEGVTLRVTRIAPGEAWIDVWLHDEVDL